MQIDKGYRARSSRRVTKLGPIAVVLLAGLGSGCASNDGPIAAPISHARLITNPIQKGGVRDWGALTDSAVWEYVVESDSIATVGLKSPGQAKGFVKGKALISSRDWIAGRASVASVPGLKLVKADDLIPWVRVKVRDIQALGLIRRMPYTEYVEPAYVVGGNSWASSSGCDQEAWTGSYGFTATGDVLPDIYPMLRIDRAWAYANGAGVWIGLTDTGADESQAELSTLFSSGLSQPRTIWRTNTDGTSNQMDPPCTHGTRLAGVLAAPMNGTSIVGVAWGANLASIQQASQLLNVNSLDAQQAIRDAGNHGAKVIEMAWQSVNWLNAVENEINGWYYNQDVVFVGAAGTYHPCDLTSSNNVVFPAEMIEVLAVSPSNLDGSRPCSAGYGHELDLIAYDNQPTTGKYDPFGEPGLKSVGESSHASALVAGIAALVRQHNPSFSNLEVYLRIIGTSGLACGMPLAWHQLVNAEAAVGGICFVNTDWHGPTEVIFTNEMPECVELSFRVDVTGGSGPIEYQWTGTGRDGQTGASQVYTVCNSHSDGMNPISVSIRDTGSSNPALLYSRIIRIYDQTCVIPPGQFICDPQG